MAKIPAYMSTYQSFKREILDEKYPIGSLIPSEAELCERFSVSRTTVRKAVEMLSREGYLKARQGHGTEVLDFRTQQTLNRVTSISETLLKKGASVRPRSIYIDTIPAPQKIADELQIPVDSPVKRIQRVQLADEMPVALMRNYLPPQLVPNIELFTRSDGFLYRYLERTYGLTIESSHDRITARCASFEDAEMLQVPMGSAIIAFVRVCFHKGKPICADHLSIVGDRYEFELDLNR